MVSRVWCILELCGCWVVPRLRRVGAYGGSRKQRMRREQRRRHWRSILIQTQQIRSIFHMRRAVTGHAGFERVWLRMHSVVLCTQAKEISCGSRSYGGLRRRRAPSAREQYRGPRTRLHPLRALPRSARSSGHKRFGFALTRSSPRRCCQGRAVTIQLSGECGPRNAASSPSHVPSVPNGPPSPSLTTSSANIS